MLEAGFAPDVPPAAAAEAAALDREQIAAHGLAWMATYVEALRQIREWAVRLDAGDAFGTTEALILASATDISTGWITISLLPVTILPLALTTMLPDT